MNWAVLIVALAMGVLAGGWLNGRLAERRPEWSRGRRVLGAAAPLPALILLATLVGMAWVLLSGPGRGENMGDLALVVTAAVGALFAVLTFIAGLVGALLVDGGAGK